MLKNFPGCFKKLNTMKKIIEQISQVLSGIKRSWLIPPDYLTVPVIIRQYHTSAPAKDRNSFRTF